MLEHESQSRRIRTDLLREMRSGRFAQTARLPRESVLADDLGISRTQLRDILASLEREGFIPRRHGVGTIINHHVLKVHTRMDIETEFLDIIRQNGHEPAVAYVRIHEGQAGAEIAERLGLDASSPVVTVTRLCTADGSPAIYCEDVFAKSMIQRPYTIRDLKGPIFDFLQAFCGVSAYLDLTDLSPVTADKQLAETFRVPLGTPLLRMDEVDYDIDGNPVFYSAQHFMGGLFRQTVMRKKL